MAYIKSFAAGLAVFLGLCALLTLPIFLRPAVQKQQGMGVVLFPMWSLVVILVASVAVGIWTFRRVH